MTIYINSPTFDLIEKDAKTAFIDKLSAIGGTLGLFTGFSLISGIEVSISTLNTNLSHNNFFQLLYFIVNMVLSLIKDPKKRRKTQS